MWNKIKNNLQFLPADGRAEEMAADIVHTMTGEQPSAMIAADPEDVMNLLSPPGTMRFFQKNASWEENAQKEEALENLCQELRQVADAGRAEYGDCLRLLLQIDLCTVDGLEEAAQCAQALTAEASPKSKVLFQVRIQSSVYNGFLGVRGLIGAWDSGL